MFVSPKIAIDKGWVTGIKDLAKQVQPNGIDITLDHLKKLGNELAVVTENGKSMRHLAEIVMMISNPGQWDLYKGEVYDGTSDVYVDLPAGVSAMLFTRSTLARNGVFILSGLYDSGYKGACGFTIYPVGGGIRLAQGTRVGQIVFVAADNAGLYAGGYNHAEGTHYTDTADTNQPLVGSLDAALQHATRGNTPGVFE